MSIEVCVLASGSSGNCTVVRTPGGVMLLDAGLGPRVTAKRLDGTGVLLRDIRAICLTHLDSDHFRPSWLGTILNHGIRIHCHRSRVSEVLELLDHDAAEPLVSGFDDAFEPLDGLRTQAIPLAHDRTGSHGFVLDGFGCRVGWATDLGRVPAALHEHFCDLDLLALESNYDPQMQLISPRPSFLKNRIMGGAGHLSNDQALETISRILDRCEQHRRRLPAHIVLLHRSRDCNCPKLMRKLFARDARIARRLTLTEQCQRSDWLRLRPSPPLIGEQLALAFG
jgi:phosphoribosyl 1,2-cyclic phosphodiesterase